MDMSRLSLRSRLTEDSVIKAARSAEDRDALDLLYHHVEHDGSDPDWMRKAHPACESRSTLASLSVMPEPVRSASRGPDPTYN
jgi:hypothetical protein